MPGRQKRLARYAQLYSRIGFVHQFRPLSGAELQTVIKRQSLQLGLGLALDEVAETNVVHAITRITGGNLSLVERLFAQKRVTQINDVSTLTADVILVARRAWSSERCELEDLRQIIVKVTRASAVERAAVGVTGAVCAAGEA